MIIFAPMTVFPAGTFLVTTAFAPTRQFSPTFTFPTIFAPAPINVPRPITGAAHGFFSKSTPIVTCCKIVASSSIYAYGLIIIPLKCGIYIPPPAKQTSAAHSRSLITSAFFPPYKSLLVTLMGQSENRGETKRTRMRDASTVPY